MPKMSKQGVSTSADNSLLKGNVVEDVRFRKLVENSHDGITMLDKNLNIIYRSKSSERIIGWKTEERIKSTLAELTHPDDRQQIKTEFELLLKTPGQSVTSIFRSKHSGGHFIWLECIFTNMLADERINAIVCNFRDISERKNLEELLYKATTLARIGAWELDLTTRKMYWSDITREIHEAELDFTPDIEAATNFYKEGKDRETVTKIMEDAVKNCATADEELQIITAKGNTKWIRVIVEAEFVDGKCSRIYGSFQDIDARKKAEIAETQALEERNTILESIGDAFFAVDKNWVVTYWNKMAGKVLGKPRNELLGYNLWDVFPDSAYTKSYKKYHLAMETNHAVHFEDYYPPLKKWYEISAYPSKNGLSVYFKDITERLNHTKAIEEQNKKLLEISWMQSHVIRAPLARIMGILELFRNLKLNNEEKKQAFEYLKISAEELDQVIRNISEKTQIADKLAERR